MHYSQSNKYFIGVVLPDDIKNKIIAFQKSFVNNTMPHIVEPHITVKARGGLSDNELWLTGLRETLEKCSTFTAEISGANGFGNNVLFLNVTPQLKFTELHNLLIGVLKPNNEIIKEYFEGEQYRAHLTLASTKHGMTEKDLLVMKERAQKKFIDSIKFTVSFVRVYRQKSPNSMYEKYMDIPLGNK